MGAAMVCLHGTLCMYSCGSITPCSAVSVWVGPPTAMLRPVQWQQAWRCCTKSGRPGGCGGVHGWQGGWRWGHMARPRCPFTLPCLHHPPHPAPVRPQQNSHSAVCHARGMFLGPVRPNQSVSKAAGTALLLPWQHAWVSRAVLCWHLGRLVWVVLVFVCCPCGCPGTALWVESIGGCSVVGVNRRLLCG
jgi:hypothetical protein